MPRRGMLTWVICLCAIGSAAQDLENLQIHGFATKSFLFSTNNNYLTMKSSDGTLQWTEGAVSVSDAETEKLRFGIQLHIPDGTDRRTRRARRLGIGGLQAQ